MYRSSWIHHADTERRQARRRDASVMATIFLVGALGVSWFVLRPDLTALLEPDTQATVAPVNPPIAYPRFSMCSASLNRDCVIDGDTFRLGTERMRIANIDTPETWRGICGGQREVALGKKAAARLRVLMNGGGLHIERQGHDRYGRTLVRVRAGGRDVGERLVSERLARHWPDGAEFWCG